VFDWVNSLWEKQQMKNKEVLGSCPSLRFFFSAVGYFVFFIFFTRLVRGMGENGLKIFAKTK